MNQKSWLLLACLVGCAGIGAVVAKQVLRSGTGDRRPLDSEVISVDFGTLVNRDHIEPISFDFVNWTSVTQHVASLRVGCGCLTATAPLPQDVRPGSALRVQLALDAARILGGRHGYEILAMNKLDQVLGKQKCTYLYKPFLTNAPGTVLVRREAGDDRMRGSTTLDVVSTVGEQFSAIPSDVSITAAIEASEAPDVGPQLKVHVTAPLSFRSGAAPPSIEIQRQGHPLDHVNIPLAFAFPDESAATPSDLMLGSLFVGDSITREVVLHSEAANSSSTCDATIVPAETAIKAVAARDSLGKWVVSMTVTPREVGILRGTLSIHFGTEAVSVPFIGQVKRRVTQ